MFSVHPISILGQVPVRTVQEVLGPHGWVFAISLVTAAAVTPLARAAAMHWRIVDKPDDFLKPHGKPVAYLGGVGIFAGWAAGMLTLTGQELMTHPWVIGLLIGGGLMMLIGLADDLFDIKPRTKLLGQLLVAVILLIAGIGLNFAGMIPSALGMQWPGWLVIILSVPMAIVLVVAAANSTNLLDGLDGLCSGVTGIIALCFLVLATHWATYHTSNVQDEIRMVASLAMVGAVLGFLPYNSNPATIFMGDAGSMLLGVYVAAMILMFGQAVVLRWVMGAVMIFGLPILDTALALIRRWRLGRPIFVGDRSHLYDQLVDRGFTVRQTVAICYGLALLYGLIGLATIYIRARYILIIYLAVAAVTLLVCWKTGFLTPEGKSHAEQESEALSHSGTGHPE